MSLPQSVEALVNERTGKYFIVLDWDGGDDKVKVINPLGEILNVPTVIFKLDEPKTVLQSDFSNNFSSEQVSKLESWESQRFSIAEKSRLERAARQSQSSDRVVQTRAPRDGSKRRQGLIDQSTSSKGKRAKVQWSGSELIFYRHKIEGLAPNDVFAVEVTGVGTFQMTKAEFQRAFNHVVMSPDYRQKGMFRCSEIPDGAKAFLK